MQLRVLTTATPEKTEFLGKHGFRWCCKHRRYEKTVRNDRLMQGLIKDLVQVIGEVGLTLQDLQNSQDSSQD